MVTYSIHPAQYGNDATYSHARSPQRLVGITKRGICYLYATSLHLTNPSFKQLRKKAKSETLVLYSLVRVSTRTVFPSSTNKGTWTLTPVSRMASFVPPLTVSPLIPGDVSTTSRSTKMGRSTSNGLPSIEITSTSIFTVMNSNFPSRKDF